MLRDGRLKFIAVISLLLLQACGLEVEPEENCNFVQNSQQQRVSWNAQVPVKFYLDDSVPSEYYGAVQAAMDEWERSLGGRQLFDLVGVVNQGDASIQDGASVIYWLDRWDNNRTNEQARTTIYWRGDQIQEADIQVNEQDFDFFWGDVTQAGAVDIESLLLHELGHALGLSHNSEDGSVMATHLSSSSLRREASKTDIDSLRCEY